MTAAVGPSWVPELLCATRDWLVDVAEVQGLPLLAALAALIDVDRQLLALLSGAADELELYGGGASV